MEIKLLQDLCLKENLDLLGITDATEYPEQKKYYFDWISSNFHGDMEYLANHKHLKFSPQCLLAGCQSIILVGLNYYQKMPKIARGHGRVARYAWGRDYHKVIKGKLKRISKQLMQFFPGEKFYYNTDATPLSERFYGERAGIGFVGKNTMLISKSFGSWFLIGEVLSTKKILSTEKQENITCFTKCQACLKCCPTGALVSPYTLDSRKCISYLTIEYKGSIPLLLRPKIGDHLFGCDICQEVCGYNRKIPHTIVKDFLHIKSGPSLDLRNILEMKDENSFRLRFAGSPLMRAKRKGLVRNACIVAANNKEISLIPVLKKCAFDDDDIVREHARWALEKLYVIENNLKPLGSIKKGVKMEEKQETKSQEKITEKKPAELKSQQQVTVCYPKYSQIRRIGISTSGGDSPGLNAVIRAVTKVAINKFRWEVVGILNGLEGLVDTSKTIPLQLDTVSGILGRGGTMLGAASSGSPFERVTVIEGKVHKEDLRPVMFENFKYLGLDALVMIGGEGTMAIAHDLFEEGLPVIGVPKTIDNDLIVSDYTFGYHTAVMTACDALDRLHDTAASHHRVMILEVMGRYSGWIALSAGIAGDADVILLPEIDYDLQYVADAIMRRKRRGKHFSVIVISEGAKEKGGSYSVAEKAEDRGSDMDKLGGAGASLAAKLNKMVNLQTRVTVLGHIQRGGSPIAFDRILASRFGVKAAEMIAKGKFGRIACLQGNKITDVPLSDTLGKIKEVDPDSDDVIYAEMLGINFGRNNVHYRY